MAASEAIATAGRAEAAQGGVEIQEIDRFEMVLQDRAAPPQVGSAVRVNDITAAKGQIDATIALMRDTAVPAIKKLNGYRALLIFLNRDSGRLLVASAWNTAADREASESVTVGLRRQAADLAQSQAGVRVTLYEAILSEVSPAAQQAARRVTCAAAIPGWNPATFQSNFGTNRPSLPLLVGGNPLLGPETAHTYEYGVVIQPRKGTPIPPKFLGGPAPKIEAGTDQRVLLAKWLMAP